MAKVEIYTTPICGYCMRAKTLLKRKNVKYEEIDLFKQGYRKEEMMTRSGGGYTVPQIFINGKSIGGSDELHALERAGKLDKLLGG